MLTDWVLIGRLARELDGRLRGGRIQEAGLLDDGRIALVFRTRGQRCVAAIDLFASPPLITLEETELAILEEPGFVRALSRALQGMTLLSISSRRFDRLLRLRFATRSRFGVGDELDLYVELVPRFGNIVLVKNGVVVAARKEFAPSENARRIVQAGAPYEMPPLPASPRTLGAAGESDIETAGPLHVYRREGKIAAAYPVPLDGFAESAVSYEDSLLALFAHLRREQSAQAETQRGRRRREALLKRLVERDERLQRELERLQSKRDAAQRREALRAEGEDIFATLHTLEPALQEPAKERAAELFAEYRKLGNSLPHIAQRRRVLEHSRSVIETLRWEAERASPEDLADVEAASDVMLRRAQTPSARAPRKRKRQVFELRTAAGSRITIGRSPSENADLTFRIARPHDLWFHAKGVPGAHVILSRDDRASVPEQDLQTAASLAAFYSKAKEAAAAPVDYTLRKHVRKQRAAPPGLVWYTNAKTILARPNSLDALKNT